MQLQNSFILVPGIGEKTERKFWQKGITHWDHALDSGELSKGKSEFLQKARRNLEVGNSLFFGSKLPDQEQWRMYPNFRSEVCFFDIETTGLDADTNKVTTVSFHRGGETRTLVRGEDLTEENLRMEINNSSAFVTFNGKRFDVPFLEKNYEVNFQGPHIDLMYLCRRTGLSGGLKPVEKQLGIDRELEDLDGREAVRLWKEYERGNEEDSLEKLVRYNRFDARNLQELLETVRERMVPDAFRQRPTDTNV